MVLALVVASPAGLANAQGPAAAPTVVKNLPASELRARTAERQEEFGQAPPEAANVGTATRAFLTASNGDAKAKITTGFTFLNETPLSLGLRLGGETPLTQGADDAALLDYRRLGDGTSVELAIQGTFWRAPQRRPNALLEWCRITKARIPDPLPQVRSCDDFSGEDLNDAPRTLYREFLDAGGWTEPWAFELATSAARNNRKFLNATTFAPDSQDRVAYSVGGNIGRAFTNRLGLRTGLVSVGYTYAVKYRARDSAQLCVPAGPSGGLQCRTGPLGAPRQRLTNATTAELRGFLSSRWGIAPQAAYLTRDREWEFAAPLYFVPDKNGVLIGGLAPSYTTDGNDWGVRLFVGATGFGLGR